MNDIKIKQVSAITSLKEELYGYIDRGWTVIAFWEVDKNGICTCPEKVKCKNPGKHPRQSFDKGGITRDKAIIDMWMENKYYQASNYAIQCGEESRIITFDIDPRHGGKRDSFDFPPTLEYRTGGGGSRLIYNYPEFDIEADSKFGEGVELIVNGLIVVPPSNHTSGSVYEWVNDLPIAAISQEFIALGNKKAKSKDGNKYYETPDEVFQGDRDNELYKMGCSLRAKGYEFDEIIALLRVANKKRFKPPLDDETVCIKAEQACKYLKGYDPNFNNNNITYANASGSPLDIAVSEELEITQTDRGNAERFARIFDGKIKYCKEIRQNWLIWNGKYWESSYEEVIRDKADKVVQELLFDASQKTDKSERAELINSAKKLQSSQGIRNMLYIAESLMFIRLKDLNNDEGIINFNNGTLDMNSMNLTDHNSKQLFTRMIDHAYKPDATCPLWLNFIRFIADNDEETIKWIQKALGWTLAGRSDGRILPFLYGEGGNGKSTFKEVLLKIFGEYAKTIPVETVLSRKFTADAESPTAFLRSLAGARLVFTSEMPKGRSLNTEKVKDLTGGDTLVARAPHEVTPFMFNPTYVMWVYGNDKPKVPDNSEGMWDRVKLIPFTKRIPDKEKRPMTEVIGWFMNEAEGIISWMVDGYRFALEEGLEPSERIAQASEEYRKDEDMLQRFIDEEMIITPTAQIRKKDFRQFYLNWLKQNNDGDPPSLTKLTQEMKKKYFESGGHSDNYYMGLGKAEEEQQERF